MRALLHHTLELSRWQKRVLVGAMLSGWILGCASEGVCAEPSGESAEAQPQPRKQSGEDLRARLEKAGLTFTFTYYGDLFANPSGGVKQGPGYDGRFGTIVDADLEKLIGWSGAQAHASIHAIHGSQFSASNLENLMTVSGIEAPPSLRLFNLWVEQKIGSTMSLRVGQFTAAQEFLVSQNATLFVNSTFGWPMLTAQDLPSGGPAYPEATPGARFQFTPNDQLTFRAAIFNGDPAGPGAGNPVGRDPFGLAFRVRDPPFLIAEIAYAYGAAGPAHRRENPTQEGGAPSQGPAAPAPGGATLPGTIRLGAWVHTGEFADQRFAQQGGLLAGVGPPALQHRGNYSVYAVLDQMLWRVGTESDRGLNLFVRAMASPSDRNPVDVYVDGGLTFKGPLASRPDDTLGLALAYGRISPRAAAMDRDVVAVSGAPMPIRDFEAAVELTYQWQIRKDWSVQPNVQYIIHPGGHVANPSSLNGAPIPNATVLGVRTMLRF